MKISRAALARIAKSDAVQLALFVRAEKIRDACDPDNRFGEDGYVVAVGEGRTRARVAVIAVHPHARNSNAKHLTILSNIDAGRD
jgi:hypothetical protein